MQRSLGDFLALEFSSSRFFTDWICIWFPGSGSLPLDLWLHLLFQKKEKKKRKGSTDEETHGIERHTVNLKTNLH